MNITDFLRKASRGPQIITPKDAATIIAETGCAPGWRVLDAGGGTGFLALMLANIGCKVYTYEKKKEFFNLLKRNIRRSGLKNVVAKNKDVRKFTEKKLDLITLDMKDSEKLIPKAWKALKNNGFLVFYSLHIEQVQKIHKLIRKQKPIFIKTVETLQRHWQIEGDTFTRPQTQMLGHTGFITIVRKL